MAEIKVFIESSKSRRGSHLAISTAVIVKSDGKMEIPKIKEETKGTYSKGRAGYAFVKLNEGDFVVWLKLIRNFMGRVKGSIIVYNWEGKEVLRLVYRKLKIRRSRGDPKYWPLVEKVLKVLKLYDKVKRINLNTGVD